MFKLFYYSVYILFVCISFNSNSATTYYKCITKKGTTFSQFPCDSHATTYKINTPSNQQTGPKVDYTKQLNELERDRLLAGFQAELRSNNHKLAILDREKQQAEFDQQQRLNRMLDKEDKKRITKDITKKLKAINKKYKKHVAKVKKQIKKLEKKITSYQ